MLIQSSNFSHHLISADEMGINQASLTNCAFSSFSFDRSFGGEVAWEGEGSPYSESDEDITHQVVDRPTQGHKFLSRSYIQPQWVVDSANHRVLMPVDLYQPGKAPPPHLSPFVDYQQEGYTPDFAVTVQKLQVGD
jgi:pescadillo protein